MRLHEFDPEQGRLSIRCSNSWLVLAKSMKFKEQSPVHSPGVRVMISGSSQVPVTL